MIEVPAIGSKCIYFTSDKPITPKDANLDEHCVVDTWQNGDPLDVIAHTDMCGIKTAVVKNERTKDITTVRNDLIKVAEGLSGNKWRGPEDGLPPVGTECEYTTAIGEPFDPCVFIGFVRGECYVLRHMDSPTSVDRFMSNDPDRFRPLRTEEEKAVEEMVAIRKAHHWTDEEFCRELYARGYRKQEVK